MAIVGGANVSTKLYLLNNLVSKVNVLMLGGAMANTFLSARGLEDGISLCERDMAEKARGVMAKADAAGCEVVLPNDVVVARKLEKNAETKVVPVSEVPSDHMILGDSNETKRVIEAIIACLGSDQQVRPREKNG